MEDADLDWRPYRLLRRRCTGVGNLAPDAIAASDRRRCRRGRRRFGGRRSVHAAHDPGRLRHQPRPVALGRGHTPFHRGRRRGRCAGLRALAKPGRGDVRNCCCRLRTRMEWCVVPCCAGNLFVGNTLERLAGAWPQHATIGPLHHDDSRRRCAAVIQSAQSAAVSGGRRQGSGQARPGHDGTNPAGGHGSNRPARRVEELAGACS